MDCCVVIPAPAPLARLQTTDGLGRVLCHKPFVGQGSNPPPPPPLWILASPSLSDSLTRSPSLSRCDWNNGVQSPAKFDGKGSPGSAQITGGASPDENALKATLGKPAGMLIPLVAPGSAVLQPGIKAMGRITLDPTCRK
jgi:hypothetical protein